MQTAMITSTKMTVASRAVTMTEMIEARTVDVEQEGHTSHCTDPVGDVHECYSGLVQCPICV